MQLALPLLLFDLELANRRLLLHTRPWRLDVALILLHSQLKLVLLLLPLL